LFDFFVFPLLNDNGAPYGSQIQLDIEKKSGGAHFTSIFKVENDILYILFVI